MILLRLLWELVLRLFWVSLAFGLLLLIGFCVTRPTQKERDQGITAACDYVMEATFSIAGHSILIPAARGTEIWFPYSDDAPKLQTYARVEALRPWTPEVLGFCGELVTGRVDPELITLERKAVEGLAAKLDLPSSDRIRRLAIGTKGVGSWLRPAEIKAGVSAETMLVGDKGFDTDGLIWQFLATAGWLESGHRLSSWCSKHERNEFARCSVRVTRRSDGMVFEAWGMHMDEMPKENAPPPEEFLILVERLPDILDMFRAPDVP